METKGRQKGDKNETKKEKKDQKMKKKENKEAKLAFWGYVGEPALLFGGD